LKLSSTRRQSSAASTETVVASERAAALERALAAYARPVDLRLDAGLREGAAVAVGGRGGARPARERRRRRRWGQQGSGDGVGVRKGAALRTGSNTHLFVGNLRRSFLKKQPTDTFRGTEGV
jgi:hypothetical protein